MIADTLERAELQREGLAVTLKLAALLPVGSGYVSNAALQIGRLFPMTLQRRGLELKLVIPGTAPVSEAESTRALINAPARSRQWFDDLRSGRALSMTAIARREGLSRRYARLLPLAFLAPVIVEAIVSGHPPSGLTAEQLTRHIALPLEWNEQQRILGIT